MTEIMKSELKMSDKTKIIYGFDDGHVEIHTRNLVSRILPDHVFTISFKELDLALQALQGAQEWGKELEKIKRQMMERQMMEKKG